MDSSILSSSLILHTGSVDYSKVYACETPYSVYHPAVKFCLSANYKYFLMSAKLLLVIKLYTAITLQIGLCRPVVRRL